MPRLAVFVPCEKVIINAGDQIPSLIALFREITAERPRGTTLAEDAGVPFRWAVYASLRPEPDDAGKTFECKLTLRSEQGRDFVDMPVESFSFTLPEHRVKADIHGFPIGSPGSLRLSLWLRELGTEDWSQMGTYDIEVTLTEAATSS